MDLSAGQAPDEITVDCAECDLARLGPAPQILDFDSNEFLRVTNDDSYEVRVGYYGNYSNAAPAFWNNISNFGL